MEQGLKELITKQKYHGTAAFDPRCKLLLLISLGFVSYFLMGDLTSFVLMLGFCLFIAAGNGMSWTAQMLVIYIIISYLNALLRYVTIPGLSVMMMVFGVTVIKMVPIVMMGRWVLKTTQMDDLTVALQRMKIPQSVIISFVVMFRYIPTLGTEYRMIRNTMAIRGICDTVWKKILHPIATVEYILIPLLMRCLKVTDELAASGTTRGLELEKTRYAIQPIEFGRKEWTTVSMAAIFLILLVILDRTYVGDIILWRV